MSNSTAKPELEVLIDEDAIRLRVAELARVMSDFYGSEPPLVIGVLNGAVIFVADLVRALDIPVTFEFMAVSSYGDSTRSSGTVRILKDLDSDIAGRRVLIVEDIVDSGATLDYLMRILAQRGPKDLRVVSLLRKPAARLAGTNVDWLGFDVDDVFVIGYGLDFAGDYRTLPYIAVLRQD